MTFRTYLRLFQPIPVLLLTATYTNFAGTFGEALLGLPRSVSYTVALVVALPLLLGTAIAAAAHTALHRPFSPLLPDVLGCTQRATLWAALAGNLAITLLVAWCFPAVPAAAVFGLAAPLLLLPCLNRRRLIARPGVFNLTVNLGALQFLLLGILGWLVFMKLAGHRLVPAMQTAPWLFFVGGLALGAWLLRRAFTRESLRERAGTPFMSPNVAWFVLLNRKVMSRLHEEGRQHIARFGVGEPEQKIAARLGRDWTVRTVGPRTRDWLRVHWHAAYGAARNGSFFYAQGFFLLVMLGSALGFPLFGYLFALIEKQPFVVIDYFGALAAASSLEFGSSASRLHDAISFMGALLTVGFAFALTLASQLRPQLPYPVSRERLAGVAFAHASLQLVFALLVPTVAVAAISLLGQTVSGKFAVGFGLPPLLQLGLVLAPFLPLAATVGRLRHMAARLSAVTAIVVAAIAVLATRFWWSDLVTTWPILLVLTLTTVGTVRLLRWQIHRHYRACDLIAEAAEAKPFLLAGAATFSRTPAPAAS